MTRSPSAEEGSWHSRTVAEVLQAVESREIGLTMAEAGARRARAGPNALRGAEVASPWKILLDQFRSVVVLILLVAAAVAVAMNETLEAAAIGAVLAINAALGFVTEYRARGAMEALLRMEVRRARALRDGRTCELDAQELVPGDVVLLEAGQSVPADARLLSAAELRTVEAALTGESAPVPKNADTVLAEDTPLADRHNLVFMSTAVVAGSARAVVVATGMNTEVGRIGALVGSILEGRTPLEHRLDSLGHRLIALTVAVIALIVGVGVWRGEPFVTMLQTGLALAIAAVPEGLPAVSTIALTIGVARMARRHALVRRLPAVEALGSATMICTDKTGTLTAGEMTVTAVWTADGEYRVSGAGYTSDGEITSAGGPVSARDVEPLRVAFRIGALCNRASVEMTPEGPRVSGDPTEAALLVAAMKAGVDATTARMELPELGEVPFSSETMLMATFHRSAHGDVAFVKGAPGRILERCERVLTAAGAVPLDAAARQRVLDQNRMMAARGLRVLALASGAGGGPYEADALQHLTLAALVGISDPPAAGVRETIARFQAAGIRTLMITGDQRLTAEAVARELGLLRPGLQVIEWRDLERLSPDVLRRQLAAAAGLSRVSPEAKLRIVTALQDGGEIVAMLGDGVNDAPALKKADIGVAMGLRGTDVAREAAAVVLQDDRFETIGAAVEQGRIIFDNIRNFVFYLFSCNLGEIFVIMGATLAGMPQPLLPLQILWLNLVTDTFPALSLAAEPGDPSVMRRPPRNPDEAILSRHFVGRVALYAALIGGVTLASFLWALQRYGAGAYAGTVAFMTLALAQTFHLGTARGRSPALSWQRMTGNRWALAAVAVTVSLQALAIYWTPLATTLGTIALSWRDWQVVWVFALIPAVIGQIDSWRSIRRESTDA